MKPWWLLWWWVCGLAWPAWGVTLNADTPQRPLAGQVWLLEDRSRTMTLDEVRSSAHAARFQPVVAPSGQPLNLGFTHSVYWVRIPLQRTADAPALWLLEIPFALIDELDFFAPGQPAIRSGSARPVVQRPVFHRHFVFPVTLDTAPQDFYLRVAADNPMTLPLVLWQTAAYSQHDQIATLLQGLYYGCVLILCVYHLFLAWSLRDRRFALYAAYCLAMGLGMFAGNGFAGLYLWPDTPQFDRISQNLFLSLAAALGLMFSSAFLQLDVRQPRQALLWRGLSAALWLVAALLWAAMWRPSAQQPLHIAFMVLSSASALGILYSGAQQWRAGMKEARLFMLGWGMVWGAALVATARAFGWLPTNAFTGYVLQIASAVEMPLLSLALADIIRHERQRHEARQAYSLDALRASEARLEHTVAERTRQIEQALQSEKALLAQHLRFSTMISHEVRNPLGIIDGQLSLMAKEHELGIQHLDKRLPVLLGAVRRMASMFNRWLEHSRMGLALDNLDAHRIPLNDWVQRQVHSNAYCLTQHRWTLTLTPTAAQVEADEYLLETAFVNLLENASKYAAAGTLIAIETRTRPGWVGIAVCDEGPGIAPEHHEDIFRDYFRLEPEGGVRGMGLGLPIVRRIVLAHQGQLELDSAPGRGSCFCIWLPECGTATTATAT
ncbi:MAG: sensor histidine kinase [Macromonas bipunctata]|nr:sensor histidine kinase [Macromonas bipunctata]